MKETYNKIVNNKAFQIVKKLKCSIILSTKQNFDKTGF